MTAAPPGQPPDGTLLSCYSASIAELLHRRGADWLTVIGLSSVLAVRPAGDGLFAFAHHAPSLRPLAAPGLRRTGTSDAGAVAAGLAAALAAAGPVIAAADAGNLPWVPAARGRQVPHWLVLDRPVLDRPVPDRPVLDGHVLDGHVPDWHGSRRWHVTDRFSAPVGEIEHRPWQGWVAEASLAGLLRLARLPPEQALRERLAFGDHEPGCMEVAYQWYSAAVPDGDRRFLAVGPPAPVRPADGWLCGADAADALADHFAVAGARPDAYRQADDLWVASRHRKLRAIALSRLLPPDDPRQTAADALARAWQRVPMVALYAAQKARRGGSKAATLASVLRGVAEAEAADARAGAAEGLVGGSGRQAQS